MTYYKKTPQNEFDLLKQKIQALEKQVAAIKNNKFLTGPIYDSGGSTLPTDAVEGQIAVDRTGRLSSTSISTANSVYSETNTIAALPGSVSLTYGASDGPPGVEFFDAGSPNIFLQSGIYAVHAVVKPNSTPANKAFGITIDINSFHGGLDGFVTANFPFDTCESVTRSWGVVTLVWYAAAGDSIDTFIQNGDSNSVTFNSFVYIQKVI